MRFLIPDVVTFGRGVCTGGFKWDGYMWMLLVDLVFNWEGEMGMASHLV